MSTYNLTGVSLLALSYVTKISVETLSSIRDNNWSLNPTEAEKLSWILETPIFNEEGEGLLEDPRFNCILCPSERGAVIDFKAPGGLYLSMSKGTRSKVHLLDNSFFALLSQKFFLMYSRELDTKLIQGVSSTLVLSFKPSSRIKNIPLNGILSQLIPPSYSGAIQKQTKTELTNVIRTLLAGSISENGSEEEVSEEDLKKEVTKVLTKHVREYHEELLDKGAFIEVEDEGTAYEGVALNRKEEIGTAFRTKASKALYTSSGFIITTVKKKDFRSVGLGSIIRSNPGIGGSGKDIVKWLYPQCSELIEELTTEYPGLSVRDYMDCIEAACMNYLTSLYNKSTTGESSSSGVTWMHKDDEFSPCRVSKAAFEVFEEDELPLPFAVWSASILANQKFFWAMLYTMFLPASTPRKQALFLYGLGNTSKSQFEHHLQNALLGTLESENVFIPRKYSTENVACDVAEARNHEVATASVFSCPKKLQFSMCQIWQETKYFHPTTRDYAKLKEELGSLRVSAEAKGLMSKTVPSNRMHFCDSNFPISGAYFTEDARVRVVEVGIASPAKLFGVDKQKFYFENLVLRDPELTREATRMCGGSLTAEYLNSTYIPFLLLRSILSYGKKCFRELAVDKMPNKAVDTTCFSLLDYRLIDRKSISKLFLISGQPEGFRSKDESQIQVEPYTIVVALFSVLLKPARGKEVNIRELTRKLKGCLPTLTGDANKRARETKFAGIIRECVENVQYALGVGYEDVYESDGVLYNVELDEEYYLLDEDDTLDVSLIKKVCQTWARIQMSSNFKDIGMDNLLRRDAATKEMEEEDEQEDL